MSQKPPFTRPPFEEALRAWKGFLKERSQPDELIWLFGENLCFETDPGKPGGFRLAYQTALTPVPANAERIAYEYFSELTAPLVFYRLGSTGAKSVCLLLCDHWFDGKGEAQGLWPRAEWGIAFRPGAGEQLEAISDAQRWKSRLLRDRPIHDLDFCMDLRAVHEILAHGRVLTTYEHYALRLLHIWRRIFDEHSHA
jgi:hypothetical protein